MDLQDELDAKATTSALTTGLAAKLNASAATIFGLSLLDDADAAAARTTLGLGTAATQASTAFAAASHNHNSDYYTETEVDGFLAGKEPSLPNKAGNALKKLRINAAANAVEYVDDNAGVWTQIATATPTGVGQVDFTSIPATYQDLLLVFSGISGNSGSTHNLTMALSPNGSTYSTAVSLLTGLGASTTLSGNILIPRYRGDVGGLNGAMNGFSGSSPLMSGGNNVATLWLCTGGIQALRLALSAGNFDAGTITLYGK